MRSSAHGAVALSCARPLLLGAGASGVAREAARQSGADEPEVAGNSGTRPEDRHHGVRHLPRTAAATTRSRNFRASQARTPTTSPRSSRRFAPRHAATPMPSATCGGWPLSSTMPRSRRSRPTTPSRRQNPPQRAGTRRWWHAGARSTSTASSRKACRPARPATDPDAHGMAGLPAPRGSARAIRPQAARFVPEQHAQRGGHARRCAEPASWRRCRRSRHILRRSPEGHLPVRLGRRRSLADAHQILGPQPFAERRLHGGAVEGYEALGCPRRFIQR